MFEKIGNFFAKLLTGIGRTLREDLLSVLLAVLAVVAVVLIRSANLPVLVVALIWAVAFFFGMRVLIAITKKAGFSGFTARYTTRDIMVMAVLIALGGIVKGYWGQARMIAEALGGFYTGVFVAWMFYLWGILGVYFVRKPFSGTISMVLGGVVEILVGNPFGLPVLLFNFWEGLAPDIVYGAFGYKRHNIWLAMGSGVLASAFGLLYGWYYFGFTNLPLGTFIVYVVLALAGGVLAGIIATVLIKLLERVGIRPAEVATVEA